MTTLTGERPAAPAAGRGRWIEDWRPDDEGFWRTTGKRVARRNLAWSILTEHLGFCVWLLWSIAVINLGTVGVALDVGQQLWLTTVPNLVGAFMRIPYTFGPARFGGRNFTIISATLLLIPCALFVYAIENPGIPFWALLLAVALPLSAAQPGAAKGAPLSGCAAKQAAIEAKLETARSFANEGQVAGLEKALSEVKEHCTEAGLLRENKQKVIDSEREVSEREKDLRKAMGKGDPEKIEKRKAKLAEARAELEEAKKGLEQAQAQ